MERSEEPAVPLAEKATPDPIRRAVEIDPFVDRMYEALRGGAAKAVRQELRSRCGASLGGTSLLHDAYIRLREGGVHCPAGTDEARYCWGAFSLAMRRLLVERARRKLGLPMIDAAAGPFTEAEMAGIDEGDPSETLRCEHALRGLLAESPSLYEVFALRHFAGLGRDEIAQLRGSTVEETKRQLEVARQRLQVLVAAAPEGSEAHGGA